MISVELQNNPYLLETHVRFNGQRPKINCQIEKYENQLLSDWVSNVPQIFYDEMNGYDFDLIFSGTEYDFQKGVFPMDDLDRKILSLLAKNARMPVKEIAEQVSLTSPAVSSRIHKLETDGIISGYTVTLNRPADRMYVDALISLSVAPSKQDAFLELLQSSKEVLQCYHVTGAYTFLVKVSCGSMPQLEHLILQFQKLGTTSTQIILSTPVNHGELDALML